MYTWIPIGLLLLIIAIFKQIKLSVSNSNYNSNKVELVDEDIKRGFLYHTFCRTSDNYEMAHALSKLLEKEEIYSLAVSRPLKDTGLWKVVIFIEYNKNWKNEEKIYVVFEISDLELFDIRNNPKISLNFKDINIKLNNQGFITPESLASLIDNSYEIKPNELLLASFK